MGGGIQICCAQAGTSAGCSYYGGGDVYCGGGAKCRVSVAEAVKPPSHPSHAASGGACGISGGGSGREAMCSATICES
jgi:hypothetical protein